MLWIFRGTCCPCSFAPACQRYAIRKSSFSFILNGHSIAGDADQQWVPYTYNRCSTFRPPESRARRADVHVFGFIRLLVFNSGTIIMRLKDPKVDFSVRRCYTRFLHCQVSRQIRPQIAPRASAACLPDHRSWRAHKSGAQQCPASQSSGLSYLSLPIAYTPKSKNRFTSRTVRWFVSTTPHHSGGNILSNSTDRPYKRA